MSISNFLTPEQINLLLNQQFNSPQGIARLNPLAFKYQNAMYPYEDFTGSYSQIDPNAPMYEDFSKPQPNFINAPQNDYASLYSLPQLDTSRFKGMNTSYGVANEPDVEQVEYLTEKKPSGLETLMQYSLFGEKSPVMYLLDKVLPKESPEVKGMKRFYRDQYGLTDTGQVASGIMAGYNPVYGGALNMLTGGRFGKPIQFGLAGAMQKRIEDILGRKAPQTDASRAKVEELRNLQLAEMKDRADRGESLSSIGKSTFTGKGKAFEAKNKGTFTTPSGQKGYYGGR